MEKDKSLKRNLIEYLRVILITLAFSYTVLFFFQISRVQGDSMLPTYEHSDILLVNKFLYKQGEPNYNDIVIVNYETEDETMFIVKRVIGVGGDCIEIIDNTLYVNDVMVYEDYLYDYMHNEDIKVDVPEGKIFVMGDNRNVSLDSRVMGYVDFEEDVIGKVMFTLW